MAVCALGRHSRVVYVRRVLFSGLATVAAERSASGTPRSCLRRESTRASVRTVLSLPSLASRIACPAKQADLRGPAFITQQFVSLG
jgi:hypothetical protein